ncbi:MAG: hypothetical protein A2600_00120 [Candidatus Lambdaproteobacteria bacterium RIFOXYD1_FULL_56_27]|uniref:HEAT repeat domain-containing protein n=1 Tax=Candidatus Lambdaproteobacteria bacterium RIFOXYD2_FULL_56_26 TaxID=1817773 RepID=A0A1F6GPQ7_9PROT|nr:MAG: hypothetical protein A2557_04240 [Candidatus Lambdaproteobacteria bacterium RIFOXYD2_FULL_56_26]OGH03924.1 MAG: hypothetical protein A2426_07465 [Candidatus Lambdaproteobacteria bacterium RIFOXYC1_FULL_56_13]OGH06181.1 MAG: hypothetical protein A2600_00120 [Candidatus Lambdaproteobacteria bacterium RIFOXYD1_FULL_56_27]
MSDENRLSEFGRLINELQHGDETNRRYAAEDLEYGRFNEAVPYLAKGLNDPSVAVAEACAAALAGLGGEPVVLETIGNLGTEDVRLRNLTCEILVRLGDLAVPMLAKELQSRNRDVRKFAVDCLLAIHSDASIKAMVVALDDSDVNVSATAADGLGAVGDSTHLEILSTYLGVEDEWMRCAVVRGITSIGGAKALRLVRSNLKSPDLVVKITCIQGIGKIVISEAAEALIEVMATEDPGFFASEMVAALHHIVVGLSAEERMGLKPQGILPCLASVLATGAEEHRLMAVELFDFLRLDSGRDALLPYLGDSCLPVREQVIATLGRQTDKDLSPFLEKLSSPTAAPAEKTGALEVAATLDPKGAERFFRLALGSEDPVLFAAGLRFLPVQEVGEFKAELSQGLSHPSPEVRKSAAELVGRAAGQKHWASTWVAPLVEQMQQESESDVKEAIDNALIQLGSEDKSCGVAAYIRSFTPEQRALAIGLFGAEDPGLTPAKILASAQDPEEPIRVVAFKVLANLGQLTYDLITQGIADPAPAVRVEAVRGLATLSEDPELVQFVSGLIHKKAGENEQVDVELIQVVVLFRLKSAGALLRPFLISLSTWVQIEAVEAARALGLSELLPVLRELSEGAEADLQSALEQAIDELE